MYATRRDLSISFRFSFSFRGVRLLLFFGAGMRRGVWFSEFCELGALCCSEEFEVLFVDGELFLSIGVSGFVSFFVE